MLSLAKAAKDYYLQKLGEISSREDYYLRGGTATGTWRGSGAAECGLAGGVNAEGLVRLFDGQHPVTGEKLGRSLRKAGVAAWDLTFSADKSVSLLWALGDPETRRQVLQAFDEATAAALSYLESVASFTRGATRTPVLNEKGQPVTGDDGTPRHRVETWPIRTTGYLAACFTEFTSRSDDPQLHTHVVVGNRVKGFDGVWRALDGRLLYAHRLAAGYIHEAVLRRQLTERLGVRWQPVQKGMADIEGFSRDQILAFSQRRQEIETWANSEGLADTPAAHRAAAIATRSPKGVRSEAELVGGWRARAEGVGLTTEALAAMMDRSREVREPVWEQVFRDLAGPQGLTKKASTFSRADVIKSVAEALPEGGTRAEIENQADAFVRCPQVVPILATVDSSTRVEPVLELTPDETQLLASVAGPHGGFPPMRRRDGTLFPGITSERRYTTAELLATELAVVNRATEGVGEGRWRAPVRLVDQVLDRYPELTNEQQQMVRSFATSGDFVSVGVGAAGVGKTAVMRALYRVAQLTGTPVLGAALAARAAMVLSESSGIPSSSLALLLSDGEKGRLPKRCLVVVDEAAMVGSRDLAKLVCLVDESEGKLVLTGDHRQLAEIDTGGLFRALAERLPSVELRHNLRQRQAWEREALAQLRDGSVENAVAMYRERGRIVAGETPEQTLTQAASDWYAHVSSTGDFTGAVLVAAHNATVRQLNQSARQLMAADHRLSGPSVTAGGVELQAGDRVLCLQNRHRLDVLNGDLGTVTAIHSEGGAVTVRLDREGPLRRLPRWYLEGGHVDYGYALTGHKAQGTTVDRAYIVAGSDLFREWGYVTMSRGRHQNTLYVVDPDPGNECAHLSHEQRGRWEHLVDQLGRSGAQTAAIDARRSQILTIDGLAEPGLEGEPHPGRMRGPTLDGRRVGGGRCL